MTFEMNCYGKFQDNVILMRLFFTLTTLVEISFEWTQESQVFTWE